MKLVLAILGSAAGGVFGYFAAHYFALWGGLMLLGDPHSPARDKLVPGHAFLFAVVFGVCGFVIGRWLDQDPARKPSGVFLAGIGMVVAAAIGIGAYGGSLDDQPPPAAPVASVAQVEKAKFKITVKAAGAAKIYVDGKVVCMGKDECGETVEPGEHKVMAENGDGRGVDQKVDISTDQVVTLSLPALEKKL